jgi:hypothetical protein
MEARYRKNAGAVFSLKYHLVWCPKYRRPVLTGEVEARLRQLLGQKATELRASARRGAVSPGCPGSNGRRRFAMAFSWHLKMAKMAGRAPAPDRFAACSGAARRSSSSAARRLPVNVKPLAVALPVLRPASDQSTGRPRPTLGPSRASRCGIWYGRAMGCSGQRSGSRPRPSPRNQERETACDLGRKPFEWRRRELTQVNGWGQTMLQHKGLWHVSFPAGICCPPINSPQGDRCLQAAGELRPSSLPDL